MGKINVDVTELGTLGQYRPFRYLDDHDDHIYWVGEKDNNYVKVYEYQTHALKGDSEFHLKSALTEIIPVNVNQRRQKW